MCQCFINIEHYEEALEYAEMALGIDPGHYNTKHRKAHLLSHLDFFEESIALYRELKQEDEAKHVQVMQA